MGVEVHEGYEFNNPDSGTIKTIAANKGVVLACGGFAGDVNFRISQDPRLSEDYKSTNLTEAPFYAARVWPKVHHTMGGVTYEHILYGVPADGP